MPGWLGDELVSILPTDLPGRDERGSGWLPFFLRPIRFGGKGVLPLFSIEVAALGPLLAYRPDPKHPAKHGFVEPAMVMLLPQYQDALAATRLTWRKEA